MPYPKYGHPLFDFKSKLYAFIPLASVIAFVLQIPGLLFRKFPTAFKRGKRDMRIYSQTPHYPKFPVAKTKPPCYYTLFRVRIWLVPTLTRLLRVRIVTCTDHQTIHYMSMENAKTK
jgi:hypothetical protein